MSVDLTQRRPRSVVLAGVTAALAAGLLAGGTSPAAAAVPGPGLAATVQNDWDGDGRADVVAVAKDGSLLLYPGNGAGGFSSPRRIGTGWAALDQVRQAGSWDGAAGNDLVARDPRSGDLLLYSGNGSGGFSSSRRIGTGWNAFSEIVAPGDWNSDGRADLMGLRRDDATVWLYPGDGRGGFGAPTRIGTGWRNLHTLTAVGDWDGNGTPDLLARDRTTGDLWLFGGDGAGRFGVSRRVGTGWGGLTALLGPGDWSGDGRSDVIARTSAGQLLLYRGNGTGGFVGPYPTIGTGWQPLSVGGAPWTVLPAFTSTTSSVSAAQLPSSYRAGCPVPPSDLRLLHLTYFGFDGKEHTGRLVVRASAVPAVVAVFRTLYDARFPVERMELVDVYGGSDARSMDANNTSAFNCRTVQGGTAWSEHSYGTAVDVNPVQNPYVSGSTVLPAAGAAYLDRSWYRTGMIRSGDVVTRAFAGQGWTWGGSWTSLKDYQHFSVSGR